MVVENKKVAAIIIAIGAYLKQGSKQAPQSDKKTAGTTGKKR